MNCRVILLVFLLVGLLVAGCSDKQKEAARLEQEMREMEQQRADSAARAVDTTTDTTLETVASDANAVPKESKTLRDMPKRPQGRGFAVQVASCEDAGYAQYLVDLYSRRGYEPYVETFTGADNVFYRVRIGLFETKTEAKDLKEILKDRYSIDPWIDQI